MFILGLGHRARHGKDTVAWAILEHCAKHGIRAKQYAFADALKAYCRVAFGMREKDAPLLQYIGTNAFRKHDPDIWVRVLLDTIREQAPEVAIITDMRFPNEGDAIKAAGGYTMRVERRILETGELWVSADRDPNHPSETAMTDYMFDRTIYAYDGYPEDIRELGLLHFTALYQHYTQQETRTA